MIRAGRKLLMDVSEILAKSVYGLLGSRFPKASLLAITLIGAGLGAWVFFAIWAHLGALWTKDHPVHAAQTRANPIAPTTKPQDPKPPPVNPKVEKMRNESKPPSAPGAINAPGGTIIQQNNQGSSGNNTQNVNLGPQARSLDQAAMDCIRSAIALYRPTTIAVMYGQNLPEVANFGDLVCKTISLPGWDVSCPTIQNFVPSPSGVRTGVVIRTPEKTAFVEKLISALRAENIEAIGIVDPSLGIGTVSIAVLPQGTKP